MPRRGLFSSVMTADGAHAAFVRTHGALIADVFGVPRDHVPASDETPVFEPTSLLRPPLKARARPKGGRTW